MAFAKKKTIGQSPSDPYQVRVMNIIGLSIHQGDGSDAVGAFTAPSRTAFGFDIGFGLTGSTAPGDFWRTIPIIDIPLVAVIPAFSRVLRANLVMKAGNEVNMKTLGVQDVVPNGKVRVNFYGSRRIIDYTVVDFQYYATALGWGFYGGKEGVDLTTDIVNYMEFTQAQYDHFNGLANGTYEFLPAMDIKSEIQYQVDRNQNAALLGWIDNTSWPRDVNGGEKRWEFSRNNDIISARHYLDIWYVPPIVLHSALITAGRPIDMSNVLDATSSDSRQHLYMGFIDQGETGDPAKYWIRNTRTDRVVRRLVIEATRSMATTPIAKATNVGTAKLRSVDMYQLHLTGLGVVDELTPRGAWYIIATDATHYSLYFQLNFDGAYVLKASGLLFSADNTLTVSSVKHIKIRAVKWSGTGTITTNDRWDFDTVSDTTDPNYPGDSRSMMSLIPPTMVGGDVADTAKIRPITGLTQRLRGSTYSVSDGGSPRSVLMLADTQLAGYAIGRKGYIFDGTGYEAVTIRNVYLTGDALPAGFPVGESGDGLMMEEEVSRSYAAGAYFTTGLYIDLLAKSNDSFVAGGGAAAGQNVINLTAAVDWIAGDSVNVINLTTGQTGSLVVQSMGGGGAVVTMSTNLTFALGAGDMVVKVVTNNASSFFVEGAVPEGALLGDRLALVRVYEARSSLQNIS